VPATASRSGWRSARTPSEIGRLTTALGAVGGVVTALDVVESHTDRMVVDISTNANDAEHTTQLTDALGALDGVNVRKVSDRTFLLHLGGKIEVRSKVGLKTRDELSMAYTPGVARDLPGDPRQPRGRPAPDHQAQHGRGRHGRAPPYSGSATSGPAAALPVMEGKAALFKRFAASTPGRSASTRRTPTRSCGPSS
jgi:malate dehydrogenase (oxaloacetate-decarboxylating)